MYFELIEFCADGLLNRCSTCRLDQRFCPGHIGHIELPIPVYNPLFFSQMYILLRSACLYCYSFRLKALEVHRYVCKLRLLQHGLITECKAIDDLRLANSDGDSENENDEAIEVNKISDSSGIHTDKEKTSKINDADLIRRRNKYVSNAIANAVSSSTGQKTAAVLEERRHLIHEFMKLLLARPKCDNCGMYE